MRICSLLPSATEICYALGLGDDVVGVSHECDYPAEAARKPRVIRTVIDQGRQASAEIHDAVRASVEQGTSLYLIDEPLLRDLAPDLILTQKLCEVCAITDRRLAQVLAGLPSRPEIISFHPHSLEEMLAEIRLLGLRTGCAREADRLISAFRARLANVRPAVKTRPRVFCLEWLDPLMAAGHWVPEMVGLAGGEEVLGRAGEPSRIVTPDEVVAARPEVLVVMPCGFPVERTRKELVALTRQPWWSRLPAVAAGRVHVVDGPAYFNRCRPRAVEGIELLAGLLQPAALRAPNRISTWP